MSTSERDWRDWGTGKFLWPYATSDNPNHYWHPRPETDEEKIGTRLLKTHQSNSSADCHLGHQLQAARQQAKQWTSTAPEEEAELAENLEARFKDALRSHDASYNSVSQAVFVLLEDRRWSAKSQAAALRKIREEREEWADRTGILLADFNTLKAQVEKSVSDARTSRRHAESEASPRASSAATTRSRFWPLSPKAGKAKKTVKLD